MNSVPERPCKRTDPHERHSYKRDEGEWKWLHRYGKSSEEIFYSRLVEYRCPGAEPAPPVKRSAGEVWSTVRVPVSIVLIVALGIALLALAEEVVVPLLFHPR